ncbi:hypothetical protein HMPREF1486_02747 [Streptomyces sp. HPH0547]|nr:hypothetical protein HMPREF1486_02747 [Streptomyces sp. HPH0547]
MTAAPDGGARPAAVPRGGTRVRTGRPFRPRSCTGLRTRPCDIDKEHNPMTHAQLAQRGPEGRPGRTVRPRPVPLPHPSEEVAR